jgi:hypothetical protein
LSKIAKKAGKKDIAAVGSMVSRKARQLSISAEAALVLLAKEHGIGTSTYQRRLDPAKQVEIRDSLLSVIAAPAAASRGTSTAPTSKQHVSRQAQLKAIIEYLVQDDELHSRCGDLLLAKSHFDRAINQATLVLEDRIRSKAQLPKRAVGENLVNEAIKDDLAKTILKISDDPDDQRGYLNIMRGVVPAFRNKTHHHIVKTFTREDALRVCGLIDVLLKVVDSSQKIR